MKNFDFGKFKKALSNLPETLAQKSFIAFLILSLLAFIISGAIFYKYGYSVVKMFPDITEQEIKINSTDYQKMLNYWDARAKIFEEADLKVFKNPF